MSENVFYKKPSWFIRVEKITGEELFSTKLVSTTYSGTYIELILNQKDKDILKLSEADVVYLTLMDLSTNEIIQEWEILTPKIVEIKYSERYLMGRKLVATIDFNEVTLIDGNDDAFNKNNHYGNMWINI